MWSEERSAENLSFSKGSIVQEENAVGTAISIHPVKEGKFYFEVRIELNRGGLFVGWVAESDANAARDQVLGTTPGSYTIDSVSGAIGTAGVWKSYGKKLKRGDYVATSIDLDLGQISFYVNGETFGPAFEGILKERYYAAVSLKYKKTEILTNFGKSGFRYEPPKGFQPMSYVSLSSEQRERFDRKRTELFKGILDLPRDLIFPASQIKTFLKPKRSKKSPKSKAVRPPEEDIIDYIGKRKEDERWDDERTLLVVFHALFDQNILSQVKLNEGILRAFMGHEKSQAIIMECIERFCGVSYPSLTSSVVRVIKLFYDLEFIEEDAIFEWHRNLNRNRTDVSEQVATTLRAKATPLVEWLLNAQEESSEED